MNNGLNSNLILNCGIREKLMKIVVTKLTDITLMQEACAFTINKESKMSLDKIYKCEHSPCRTQMFKVEMYDIPTFVSVHLVRHKIGVEHFVKSNREDRPGYTGTDLGREQPVNHMMVLNAQALIQMSRKRLCTSTHLKTRQVMLRIKACVAECDPDLAKYMVRECEYRNGKCPELKSCGSLYKPERRCPKCNGITKLVSFTDPLRDEKLHTIICIECGLKVKYQEVED